MSNTITIAIIKQWLKEKNRTELTAALNKTKDIAMLIEILRALGKLQAPAAITAISGCLQHQDFQVKQSAVQALGQIKDKQVVPELLGFLKTPNPVLQSLAITGLANITDDRIKPVLRELVANKSEIVRKAAAKALKKLGEDQWLEAVRCEDGDFLRLAQKGAQPPVDILLKQLSDNTFSVREKAAKTLIVMAGNQPQRLQIEWAKICQLIRTTHKSSHQDQHIAKSSDCDYHTDTHTDTGVGLKFPTEIPKDF